MVKKFFKWIFLTLIFLGVLLTVTFFVLDEKLPEGIEGEEADRLALKIQENLYYDAFKKTAIIEWSFPGEHHYIWNKKEENVIVKWGGNKVSLDLKQKEKSEVLSPSGALAQKEKSELINKAIDYFNNDSFWLIAPFKLFDTGVTRKLVNLKDGNKGLLITYTKGGSTPGDSYLWRIDENGRPVNFKMWVSIIPIGGLEASWDEWKKTKTGILLATSHKILFFNLKIDNLETYN
ncbi:hypothetical protein [Ascidiimonas sp. W6]|uniref:hypothetical protein n=1 Tax=Ascidiimonas meishanensis TaxID=3128903 RepID=UPI0030EC1556